MLSSLEPLPELGAGAMVIVPGMPYRATQNFDRAAIRWLRHCYENGATVASVCTGSFALGEAGLLDGRFCTTHWSRVGELERRFPKAKVVADRLFVFEDRIMTSAGIAAGIDMALAIIEKQHGPRLAAQVAREMVIYIRRDGAQEQTSVYLDYRTHLHPGIHRVQDFITQNPSRDTSLTHLASIGSMSERNLTRLFRQTTGITIKEYTTRVRLELARSLLHDPSLSLDAVAMKCGWSNARQFRRVWHEVHGTPPSAAR
jgi:transcriptional regulator GlxA family with amidase domain